MLELSDACAGRHALWVEPRGPLVGDEVVLEVVPSRMRSSQVHIFLDSSLTDRGKKPSANEESKPLLTQISRG